MGTEWSGTSRPLSRTRRVDHPEGVAASVSRRVCWPNLPIKKGVSGYKNPTPPVCRKARRIKESERTVLPEQPEPKQKEQPERKELPGRTARSELLRR